jgi:hypothetical protein
VPKVRVRVHELSDLDGGNIARIGETSTADLQKLTATVKITIERDGQEIPLEVPIHVQDGGGDIEIMQPRHPDGRPYTRSWNLRGFADILDEVINRHTMFRSSYWFSKRAGYVFGTPPTFDLDVPSEG